MFRRITIPLICLAVLVVSFAGLIWFHYLRYPDMPPPTTQASDTLRIRPPKDAFCQRESRDDSLGSRVILVNLHTNNENVAPAITINHEHPLSWPKAAEILHAIYAVRAARVAFLQSDPGVNGQYVREMMDILRKAEVTDICIVDPANPPPIDVYPRPAS